MLIFHKLFTNEVIFLEYHGVRDLSDRNEIATYGAHTAKPHDILPRLGREGKVHLELLA